MGPMRRGVRGNVGGRGSARRVEERRLGIIYEVCRILDRSYVQR